MAITINGIVTIYWQTDSVLGVCAFIPGFGFDVFESFRQLDMHCTVEFFGYDVRFVQIESEEHRLQLEIQGVFRV